MNFVSKEFFAFLAITLTTFYCMPKQFRLIVLLIASYVFYASWSIPFILVILFTTTFDYYMGKIISGNRHSTFIMKFALISGITLNLISLCFFKYTNLLLESLLNLSSFLHVNTNLPNHLNILLPIGISFYTFEALSYLIDVYRGQKPANNFIQYNFYIMFFPHLISGPIIRFNELSSQYIKHLTLPSLERVRRGIELIVLGYFFKVCIADQTSAFSDPIFMNASAASPLETLTAILGFAVQLYFDFMGYTHIARGVALLFNLEFPLNFNHPFNALSISDHWRRWHMSLTRWIRDYLFVPMGGSRCSTPKLFRNLFVSMTIVGIWHGSGLTYMVWGIYHGFLLSVYHVWKLIIPEGVRTTLSKYSAYSIFSCGLTFIVVLIGYAFFRSPNMETAFIVLQNLFSLRMIFAEILVNIHHLNFYPIATILYLLTLCLSGPLCVVMVKRMTAPMPYWLKSFGASMLMSFTWIFAASDVVPFIYFQF